MRVPERKRTAYTWRWAAALGVLVVASVTVITWLSTGGVPGAHADSLVVDTIVDDVGDASPGDGDCDTNGAGTTDVGDCTLRAALEEAMANAEVDTISFNIAGTGPHTILIDAVGEGPLPDITDDDLTIDAGAEDIVVKWENDPGGAIDMLVIDADRVEITGTSLALDGDKGAFTTGNGMLLDTGADDNMIDNVEVTDFDGDGIHASGDNDGNTVQNSNIHDNGANGIGWGTGLGNGFLDNDLSDNGADGIALAGGDTNEVSGSTIEQNGADGIDANNEDDLIITSNTIRDNATSQIYIHGASAGNIDITNNLIDVDSDGIVLDDNGCCDGLNINGGAESQANQFRGSLGGGDYYVENNTADDVDAQNNDWNAYTETAIEALICAANATDLCGAGEVDFTPFLTSAGGGVATPTPTLTPTPLTPTATPTVTGTPPTSTATPTATGTPPTATPTRTPTVGPQETISLVVGCNFVTWTGTSINPPDLAALITGTIRGLWAQQPAPLWRGYNALYPDASDMLAVGHVDVVAACMDSSGTLTRPLI